MTDQTSFLHVLSPQAASSSKEVLPSPNDAAVSEAALLAAPKRTKLVSRPHRAPALSNTAGIVRKTSWSKREEERAKQDAIKQKEREMRQAKEDQAKQKREQILERKRKKEEKERLDAMAAKVSVKERKDMLFESSKIDHIDTYIPHL